MGTKTIGLDDEAYERLKAEKREDESFSDTVKRLTRTVSSDWRHSFGRYEGERGTRFEAAVDRTREAASDGLGKRQRRVNEIVAGDGTTDASGDDAETEDG